MSLLPLESRCFLGNTLENWGPQSSARAQVDNGSQIMRSGRRDTGLRVSAKPDARQSPLPRAAGLSSHPRPRPKVPKAIFGTTLKEDAGSGWRGVACGHWTCGDGCGLSSTLDTGANPTGGHLAAAGVVVGRNKCAHGTWLAWFVPSPVCSGSPSGNRVSGLGSLFALAWGS